MRNETSKLKKLLAEAKDVLEGIASEQGIEAISKFGDPSLLERVDKALGYKEWDGVYHVVPYRNKGEKLFGICTDRDNPGKTWVLTGMRSVDDAKWAIETAAPGHKVEVAA